MGLVVALTSALFLFFDSFGVVGGDETGGSALDLGELLSDSRDVRTEP